MSMNNRSHRKAMHKTGAEDLNSIIFMGMFGGWLDRSWSIKMDLSQVPCFLCQKYEIVKTWHDML